MPEKKIIQSYGLRWKEADVFWGAGSSPGRLLGVPDDNITANATDFREQIGIYILYSGNDLIYVGQAGARNQKLLKRLNQHRNPKNSLAGRWDSFSWFGLRRVIKQGKALSQETMKTGSPTTSMALNHIEAVLIAATEPSMNKQWGKFGEDTKQYLQVRDERLTTEKELLEQVLEQLYEIKHRP